MAAPAGTCRHALFSGGPGGVACGLDPGGRKRDWESDWVDLDMLRFMSLSGRVPTLLCTLGAGGCSGRRVRYIKQTQRRVQSRLLSFVLLLIPLVLLATTTTAPTSMADPLHAFISLMPSNVASILHLVTDSVHHLHTASLLVFPAHIYSRPSSKSRYLI